MLIAAAQPECSGANWRAEAEPATTWGRKSIVLARDFSPTASAELARRFGTWPRGGAEPRERPSFAGSTPWSCPSAVIRPHLKY